MSCSEPDELWIPILHWQIGDVATLNLDLPFARPFETHEHLGEGRLAAARFTDDGHRLAFPRDEIELLIGLDEPPPRAPLYQAAIELSLELVIFLACCSTSRTGPPIAMGSCD